MELISENDEDKRFFDLRREGKIYVSKLFRFSESELPNRNVRMVFENSDNVEFGEFQGATQINVSPKGKNQISAIVFQDNKKITRLNLSSFRVQKNGAYISTTKVSFTFRNDEFNRLLNFLRSIEFIDFSNPNNFHIEDKSGQSSRKTIVDKSDGDLVSQVKSLDSAERSKLLSALKGKLTSEDLENLFGRRETVDVFSSQISKSEWSEKKWQEFFELNQWIFGLGLDLRIMKLFDREMAVGHGGTANREKPIIDFLMTFNDFTALVEIKKPNSKIFSQSSSSRSGIANFSTDFVNAISQSLEQKAEWLSFAQSNEHFNRTGSRKLLQRTRDSKIILVYGNTSEFSDGQPERDAEIKKDTFELFRRGNRSIEILTFDELLQRAEFIAGSKTW